jgi:DNA-binding IclR family transcriptional regulator
VDYDLKEKILKVINNSPNGITLTKAGKKIGVEWRTLIRPAKELLEVGDVRKKDTYYFPS